MDLEIDLISIGNSKGIRLPKSIIEACGLGPKLQLKIVDEQLIISASKPPRLGWRELFASKNLEDNDKDLSCFREVENTWDNEEWTW